MLLPGFRDNSQRDLYEKAFGFYTPQLTHSLHLRQKEDEAIAAPCDASSECILNDDLTSPKLYGEKGEHGENLETVLVPYVESGSIHRDASTIVVTGVTPIRSDFRSHTGNQGMPFSPFVVAETDEAIIKDHNDIWNEVFKAFLLSYITEIEVKKVVVEDEVKKQENKCSVSTKLARHEPKR